MNRMLQGVMLTAFAVCSTISCSGDTSAVTGVPLDDPTAKDNRVASASVTLADSSIVVGGSTQATAYLYDRWHHRLYASVTWRSSDTTVAIVSSTGLITGIAAGAATISATRWYTTGSAVVTVTAPAAAGSTPVSSVSVALAASSLNPGQTTQATAVTRDANNNVLTGRTIVWSTDNAAAATVDAASGLVTAIAAGTAKITASSEGQSGSAALTVVSVTTVAPPPVSVASVSVSPATATVDTGLTTQLSATTLDSANNVLTGRTVTWASANPAIATVSSTGLVKGIGAGSTQISATSEGKSGSATVTVNAPAPPPPPPVTGSFEPAGMTKITDRQFNSTTSTYTAGEDGWWDSDNGATTIVQDATAPRSPNNVARMTFPAGMSGGYAPSTLERQVSGTTVYLSAWVKMSSNWQSHPSSVNKMLHFWINGANRLVITAASYDPYGPLTARISLQGIVSGGNNADGGISGTYESNVEITRGAWHKVEVIAHANSNGASDGWVKLYVDGVFATSCSGIRFVSGAGSFDLISWSPTWGGTGATVTSTMYEWMDHVYISSN